MTTEHHRDTPEHTESPKPPQRTGKGQPADDELRHKIRTIIGEMEVDKYDNPSGGTPIVYMKMGDELDEIMELIESWADTRAREAQNQSQAEAFIAGCLFAGMPEEDGQIILDAYNKWRTPEQEGTAS